MSDQDKGYRNYTQISQNKTNEFVNDIPALLRAFDLELIPSQRLIEVILPPFIKLAQKSCAVAVLSTRGRCIDPDWLGVADKLFCFWSDLFVHTVAGDEQYLDSKRRLQPLMGHKMHSELLNALVNAKAPEVRRNAWS